MKTWKNLRWKTAVAVLAAAGMAGFGAKAAEASQLSGDARASIPKDVQQIIVVDYKAMQNSPAAMQLKDRVLPPELKRLETALRTSGLKVDQDCETLAFAAFRAGSGTRIIGVAQGQFQNQTILANFARQKIKPQMIRNTQVWPMGSAGMSVAFLNQTTMVFGDHDAVKEALDARDGLAPNFLQNGEMMSDMSIVDMRPVWSLLDQRGTQTMMKSVLGDASQLADFDTVKNRMRSARYTLDFGNGVKFNMTVVMSDTTTAALAATVMKGVVMMKKSGGSPLEKSALDETRVDSSSGTLTVDYSSSDLQFAGLLSSPLFQQVVR